MADADSVWVCIGGSTVYDNRTSLGYVRHGYGNAGRYVVFYTGGVEAAEFMGTKLGGVTAVADDFGNLVRVAP